MPEGALLAVPDQVSDEAAAQFLVSRPPALHLCSAPPACSDGGWYRSVAHACTGALCRQVNPITVYGFFDVLKVPAARWGGVGAKGAGGDTLHSLLVSAGASSKSLPASPTDTPLAGAQGRVAAEQRRLLGAGPHGDPAGKALRELQGGDG